MTPCPNANTAPTTHATTKAKPTHNTPTTGLRERGNDTSKSTGRSGRQKAATRRNMRREERVTVQGPVKEQQPDGRGSDPRRGWGAGTEHGTAEVRAQEGQGFVQTSVKPGGLRGKVQRQDSCLHT